MEAAGMEAWTEDRAEGAWRSWVEGAYNRGVVAEERLGTRVQVVVHNAKLGVGALA